MQLQLDVGLHERIPGIKFGTVTINGVHVREKDEQLWNLIEELSQNLTHEYSLDRLSENERIGAVRGLQKAFGFDPTRYRPSSEALLRRVLKGLGLYQINTAVDVNNFCSLEFLLPMCIYDLQHIKGQPRVRIGEPGEQYPGIGRQIFQMENKLVIADDDGIIGNTVSDSERTKVTTSTTDMLLVIHAPAGSTMQTIQRYASLAGQRMVEFNGGQMSDVQVLVV
jgi:DNA/RNA-binding domain of Phe-tRNA-synthetase-like protein